MELEPTLRVHTRPCAIAKPPKPKSYTRSITWPILICRRLGTLRRKRLSIFPPKYRRQIRNWNSARLTLWQPFRHVTHSNEMIGRRRRRSEEHTSELQSR